MGKIAKVSFDYSIVDKDTKGKLINLAGQIGQHKKKHAESGMEIGRAVATAHALLAVDGKDGKFSQWVESECGFSRTTAYNYMWTFQRFGNCSTVEQFDSGALYALAPPKVPEKAVKEAEKLAGKGEKITLEKAKELVKKFREVQERAAAKPPAQSDAPPAEPAGEDDDDREWINDHVREEPAKSDDHPAAPKISGGTTFNPAEFTSESKDAFGEQVSEELVPAFELCEEFDAQRAKLTGIKSWVTQRIEHPGAVVLKTAAQRLRTAIDEADAELRFSRPHCECVYCRNQLPKVANCTACKGLGWMTKPVYDAAPKDMKRGKAKG